MSTSEETVERVARALHEHWQRLAGLAPVWNVMPEKTREAYLATARVAVAAMSPPLNETQRAVDARMGKGDPTHNPLGNHHDRHEGSMQP